MTIKLATDTTKDQVFHIVRSLLENEGFVITDSDKNRPWGGFFVIDEQQTQLFIDQFFNDLEDLVHQWNGKISPKILIVENEKRLSWRFHHRRAEIWKVIGGKVAVISSQTDIETEQIIKVTNDLIILKQKERHRLIGFESWGIVAEIWQHTDNNHPSDEQDIVRIQDDYGR